MSDLFRTEALGHSQRHVTGAVLLARPLAHTVLTLLFSVAAAALIAFFASFSYTSKARVPGVLLPTKGLIRVMPMQAGLVTERRVREGQFVKAGEVLFVLVSERSNALRGNAEKGISALLQQRHESLVADRQELALQLNQRTGAARRKSDALQAERARVDQQIGLQRRRVGLADAALKRIEDLAARQFVSAVQAQDKQAELLDQEQKLAELERGRASVDRELAALRDEIEALQIQARRDRETGERGIADAERELTEFDARRQLLVTSPDDGTVSAITVDVGQSVAVGQHVAVVLPAGSELEAELYAPSRAAGFLSIGAPVTLRYQAYAYQKFGQIQGRVTEVSSIAMRPEDMALPGAALASIGAAPTGMSAAIEPLYRVRVAIPRQTVKAFGQEIALRSGAALDASILLQTRRLYELVLEPLYTVQGQL